MSFSAAPLSLVEASVFHGRKGRVRNAFTYRTDFVLVRVDQPIARAPRLLSLGGFGLWSLRGKHYGNGRQTLQARAQDVLQIAGVPESGAQVWLLTQPACLGYSFNPVSFWFVLDGSGLLRAVVSEVNNTSGDRHCYVSRRPDKGAIGASDVIPATKHFYVSPFQPIDGGYRFQFSLEPGHVSVRIFYDSASDDGLSTSLMGNLRPLTNKSLALSFLRLPFGPARVMVLILWQALQLKLKGARYRSRTPPPVADVTS